MTSKTQTVRARIEPETKRKAEAILKRLGLSHSALINMTYRAVVETGGIPFSLRIPNAETARELEKLRNADYRAGLVTHETVDELMADLMGERDEQ